jgi:hypothetical protein
MTIVVEALIEGFTQLWTFATVSVVVGSGVVAGLAAGAVVTSPHVDRAAHWYVLHVPTMITVVTAPFWLGRAAFAFFDHDPFWGRIAAGFFLMLLYALCVGIGLSLAIRYRRRRHITDVDEDME